MNKIRLSKSSIGLEEKEAVVKVLDKEFLGMGEEVSLFEQRIAETIGVDSDCVVCVNTGTSALHIALAALDIGLGDEVLVPSITYVASLQAISATGATPVLCDVLENNAFIDLSDASKRITPKTKAIMPVHYASNCYGMDKVYDFSKKFNLRVIEDAAHSIGSKRHGVPIGQVGDVICFSFDGIKNVTSGEGGAIVTSDPLVIERVKDSRLLGVVKDTEQRLKGERSWFFDVERQGFRYHMSNIMAAIGIEQLKKITHFGTKRRECVNLYRSNLMGVKGIIQLDIPVTEIFPHIYVIKVSDGYRNELIEHLKQNNIECGIHYQPNHLLSLYKTIYSLPVSEKLFTELLTLPLHVDLSLANINRICKIITEFMSIKNA